MSDEKNRRCNGPKLSDEELRILGAFLDGELSEGRCAQIRKRLESGDLTCAEGLEGLKQVRLELRQWHAQQGAQAPRVDLWSRLEPILAAECEAARLGKSSRQVSWIRNGEWRNRIRELIIGSPVFGMPRALVLGASCAAVVALAASQFRNFQETQQLSSIAGIELPRLSSSRIQRFGDDVGPLRVGLAGVPVLSASGRPSRPMLLVSERAAQDYRQRFEPSASETPIVFASNRRESSSRPFVGEEIPQVRSVLGSGDSRGEGQSGDLALRVPLGRAIDQRFVLNGVRADGADIDWLSSDNSVDIVSTQNRAEVPIIWVARRGH